MNIHKRGIALSGRFCRLEHPSNTHTHHPRKKTSTSSTNLKPNTTHGRRQVPQVQIWNQTPPKEEDKYLKYESETKHHSSTFKHQKEDPKARQIAKHHQQLKTAKYSENQ